ncbi:MAG: hypothetical protein QOI12_5302 [Alphaproteobacteria bacterium]|jgi:hypothetical protein|nr:hypothetical protein [Alphaproteobacteria bacterium]
MSAPHLTKETWFFDDFFAPATKADDRLEDCNAIMQGRSILDEAKIDGHPFFLYATSSRESLRVWAMQESVVTNHFSQVLFAMLALINNVHVRSILVPVVWDEHSSLRNGVAFRSHPQLLANLIADLGIEKSKIKPLPFTLRFADLLTDSISSLLYALGVLGIGNESMLIPEYIAVEKAFAAHYPKKLYSPFLRANIEEDKTHSRLLEVAAACLIRNHDDENEYVRGAHEGVNGRLQYYDALLSHCQT